jgi:hypothetical protein
MREPESYVAEIERITGDPVPGDGQIETHFSWETPEEARQLKRRLDLMQKELRLLKKEVRADMAEIKSAHVLGRSNVQAGFFASAFGSAAKDRAYKRDQLKVAEAQGLHGHRIVDNAVDQLLFQIDQTKDKLSLSIAQAKAEAPVRRAHAPAAAPAVEDAVVAQMRQLKQLHDEGIISGEDYEAKKAEILSRM